MSIVSEKAKARWADPVFRAKMKDKLKQFWTQKENKERMRLATKQAWEGATERREAVSNRMRTYRSGRKLSPEHIAAIKASAANVPYDIRHHLEPGTREKRSAANKGRQLTDEQRTKLSIAMKTFQASIQLQRRALSSARRRAAMDNWHRCQCNDNCMAIVKAADKMYA